MEKSRNFETAPTILPLGYAYRQELMRFSKAHSYYNMRGISLVWTMQSNIPCIMQYTASESRCEINLNIPIVAITLQTVFTEDIFWITWLFFHNGKYEIWGHFDFETNITEWLKLSYIVEWHNVIPHTQ